MNALIKNLIAAIHNIARLLRAAIAVSLHSDDPCISALISHSFEQTATALGISPFEVVELNKNAIRSTFVDRDTKQRLLAIIASNDATDSSLQIG